MLCCIADSLYDDIKLPGKEKTQPGLPLRFASSSSFQVKI